EPAQARPLFTSEHARAGKGRVSNFNLGFRGRNAEHTLSRRNSAARGRLGLCFYFAVLTSASYSLRSGQSRSIHRKSVRRLHNTQPPNFTALGSLPAACIRAQLVGLTPQNRAASRARMSAGGM